MGPAENGERRTPDQWVRLVAEHPASGHSQRRFCAEHGIGQSRRRYWRRRLGPGSGAEGGQGSPGIRWVAVKVLDDAPALADRGLVVVSPRGVRVEIARGVDAATLTRVLATLEVAA